MDDQMTICTIMLSAIVYCLWEEKTTRKSQQQSDVSSVYDEGGIVQIAYDEFTVMCN